MAKRKRRDVIMTGGVLGVPRLGSPGMSVVKREGIHKPVDYTRLGWGVPGGKVTHNVRASSTHTSSRKTIHSSEPAPIDAVFWERDQYSSPLGPSQGREQYAEPIGPSFIDRNQYPGGAGPSQGRIQYDQPIGPRRQTFREKVSEKASAVKKDVVSTRDEIYGYRHTKNGKIVDSGVGRINFFNDTGASRLLGGDPANLSGHSATREIFGSRRSGGGGHRRSRRHNDDE